ncbi:MAG TPA: hypothetical protein VGC66_23815 [Pyrinomonadaceae bacterium]|jgi:hypothetical protein
MLFGSTVLEVAIGMIFIYLLLSLICSAANEVIATNTKRRAWMLEEGIRNLLRDDNLNKQLTQDSLEKGRVEVNAGAASGGEATAVVGSTGGAGAIAATLSNIFYEHPLIRSLYQPNWRGMGEKKPAYIPARTFALTILDIITPEKPGQSRTINDIRAAVEGLPEDSAVRRSLLTLIDEAEGDIEKLRINVEDWFNVGMDRVSDWYKRRTHRVIFIIGLVLAVILNADTIMILKVLYSEPAVRTSMLAQAEAYAKNQAAQPTPSPANTASGANSAGTNPPGQGGASTGTPGSNAATQKEIDEVKEKLNDRIQEYRQLENLGLPVGWSNKGTQVARRPTADFKQDFRRFLWEWLLKIAGLLITGVALSLGAPFWFDLLNRFISFRTALKPPEATPEKRERSMSLTTPPRPPNEPGHSALPLEAGSGAEETAGDNPKTD